MSEYAGKTCPYCKSQFTEQDQVEVCADCGMPHHLACWAENNGCTTFGCSGKSQGNRGNSGNACVKCGNPLAVGQEFCVQCGMRSTPVSQMPPMPQMQPQGNACVKCGNPLAVGQEFCVQCGMRSTPVSQMQPMPQPPQPQGNACVKCGNPLADGQEFCVQCGMRSTPVSQMQPQGNICGKCGNMLADGQEFCPKCGQKSGLMLDASVANGISQLNAGIVGKKKKKNSLPIVAAVVVIVGIFAGIFISNQIEAKKAEEEANRARAEAARILNVKEDYVSDARTFASKLLTAGENLEDISDTIQRYWHEHIYDDKHGSSIDTAILYALVDKSSEIDTAEVQKSEIDSLYRNLKSLPEDISNDRDMQNLADAVKDFYNIYTDFYVFATDPSGNYNSFSSGNSEKTDTFISRYNALRNLLD